MITDHYKQKYGMSNYQYGGIILKKNAIKKAPTIVNDYYCGG